MTARIEQETTITVGRDDEWVQIYTSDTTHLRRLRNDERVEEVRQGDEEHGFFRVPASAFNVPGGFRRKGRVLSDEERAALADRLAAARSKR